MNTRRKPGLVRTVAKAAAGAAAAVAIAVASAGPVGAPDPTLFLKSEAASDLPPSVLLPYQQAWVADEAQLKIGEKSRRIGLTWAEASDDVLIAAAEGGSNVFYISATQDMAREYVEACAMWARNFDRAASEISEGIFDDGRTEAGEQRNIKTYEITFPDSGKRIVALSSRPTNLRGKQGVIVIDEAAFAQDLPGLLKAAMAMLLWGDKVRIISTHDGVENAFNELVQEVRAGKRGPKAEASVHRITFRQAVADGLYRRVCLRKGIDWTPEGEQKWVDAAYRFYGDNAAEELDAIPSQGGGRYLSLALIEQRSVAYWTPGKDQPTSGPALVRGNWQDDFAWLPEDVRRFAILGWCRENLDPVLAWLHKDRRHVFGEDFARNRNLTSITVLEEDVDLTQRCKLQLELFNCPFSSQQQILFYIIDKLPRFRGGAMDAGGNGAALAEAAAQKYGTEMVERIQLNNIFYLEHMPKLKAGLEDGTLTDIPRDAACRDDLRALALVKGIPKLPDGDTAKSAAAKATAADGGEKLKRHGDFAISLFMARYAFFREAGETDWQPAPGRGRNSERADDVHADDDDDIGALYQAKGGY